MGRGTVTMLNTLKKILHLEKRKYKRFNIDNCKLMIYGPNSPKEREILDLSPKGISILYTDEGKPLKSVFDFDLRADDIFHLGKVRAKTISDVVASEFVMRSKTLRRLGAEIINIHPFQEQELKKFLRKHGRRSAI